MAHLFFYSVLMKGLEGEKSQGGIWLVDLWDLPMSGNTDGCVVSVKRQMKTKYVKELAANFPSGPEMIVFYTSVSLLNKQNWKIELYVHGC